MLLFGMRISAVITLSALVSYFHIMAILSNQAQDSLQKYIVERGAKEDIIFSNAERNHQIFKQKFLAQWPGQNSANTKDRFNRLFILQNDGSVALVPEAFKGMLRSDGTTSRHISAYIGSSAPVKDVKFNNKLLLSYELIDRFSEAWTRDYANLYVSMPENVNIVYWPGVPWGTQASSDLDVNNEEWVYIASPEHNPAREPVWTGLYFDQTADEWMVSLATPIDYKGEHLINIGHDILLNTLFNRVFDDKLAGAYNFIFREDGRIIAHPDLIDELRLHKGVLNTKDISSVGVNSMVNRIQSLQAAEGSTFIAEDEQSDSLLAVTRIDGPDWFFVTVFPKSLLSSTALSVAYIVATIGLISLLLELLIFFGILKHQVLIPIQAFRDFSKKIAVRNFGAIDSLKKLNFGTRNDEVGELANTMTMMATTIKLHEEELEHMVEARTTELIETNLILSRESKEHQDVLLLLQTIAKHVSGLQGGNYFNTLSEFLSSALDADFVIICRLSEDRKVLHTLSAVLNNKIIDNTDYEVAGTPCEVVIETGTQVYNGDVQQQFPQDQELATLGIHSYIGTPMFDSSGNCIGHLAVMKKLKFPESNKARLIIDSVSSRASSELIRQVNEEIIMLQATTDALTGLPNRPTFLARLHQALLYCNRNNQQLAVMFIDLDNFKSVNDNFGHAAGDELLKTVARRLERCVRQSDLVARMGGDEFIVLLNSISELNEPDIVAHNIMNALNRKTLVSNIEHRPSCSIGIAIYPEDGTSDGELLNNADSAMYRAKELGKNNVQFFTLSINQRLKKIRQTELDLNSAITNDEFVNFYQPINCLQTNTITSMEALVRWNHPHLGITSPDSFISIAEKSGLISTIGQGALETVCLDFKELKRCFPELQSIAVNFSVVQFRDPQFANYLLSTLDKHNIGTESIEMEITESFFIDVDDSAITDQIYMLRDHGIKIVLDDFGTGYSSLGYLKQFPVDTLKIDRRFVRDLSTDKQSQALVSSIISLAKNFHLSIVAEGVEEKSQELTLKLQGCDFAQGYYYARPMSLADWLQNC